MILKVIWLFKALLFDELSQLLLVQVIVLKDVLKSLGYLPEDLVTHLTALLDILLHLLALDKSDIGVVLLLLFLLPLQLLLFLCYD